MRPYGQRVGAKFRSGFIKGFKVTDQEPLFSGINFN